VSILSFNGRVQFGLLADAALVPDPHAITERFEPEFEQLLYFALLQDPQSSEEPEMAKAKPRAPRPPGRRVVGGKRSTRARAVRNRKTGAR
jgi:hypothetical protein